MENENFHSNIAAQLRADDESLLAEYQQAINYFLGNDIELSAAQREYIYSDGKHADADDAINAINVWRAAMRTHETENGEGRAEWRKNMETMTVTSEQVKNIEDSKPLWNDTIFHQKWHVWIAMPEAGKTALATQAAREISTAGFEVFYFNLDSGASDLKHYHAHAVEHDYNLIAPLAEGMSDDDCIAILSEMKFDPDLSDIVIFLDTLKKFVEVVSKTSKHFYSLLRALTARGATVITLGHANKFLDQDGNLVYEGTGDLKADCDVMMMLYSTKEINDVIVSTQFEKQRALVKEHTFRIAMPARVVTIESELVDVQQLIIDRQKEAGDADKITAVKQCLERGTLNETRMLEALKTEHKIGARSARRVLKAYADKHWERERAFENNQWLYHRIQLPRTDGETGQTSEPGEA